MKWQYLIYEDDVVEGAIRAPLMMTVGNSWLVNGAVVKRHVANASCGRTIPKAHGNIRNAAPTQKIRRRLAVEH